VIASGAISPLRTVSTTLASRRITSCCTKATDTSSSRCASSTPSITPQRPALANNAALARRSSQVGSEPMRPNVAPNAPSGSTRADADAVAQCTTAPVRSAIASASRASRVFPTPAAPASTTPDVRPARTDTPPTKRISSARPTSGHRSARTAES
jgi:hypothetical protein